MKTRQLCSLSFWMASSLVVLGQQCLAQGSPGASGGFSKGWKIAFPFAELEYFAPADYGCVEAGEARLDCPSGGSECEGRLRMKGWSEDKSFKKDCNDVPLIVVSDTLVYVYGREVKRG